MAVGRPEVQSHPWLWSEYAVRPGYIRPSLSQNNRKTSKKKKKSQRDGFVSQFLLHMHEDLNPDCHVLCKKPNTEAGACNLSAREAETGGYLGSLAREILASEF